MRISFDPKKRDRTFKDRGLDFEDAALVFEGTTVEIEDLRRNYGEPRILCYGLLFGRIVVIGYTLRGATRHVLGPVHAMDANANGRHGAPIKAHDEAKTGRLREESNTEWRP